MTVTADTLPVWSELTGDERREMIKPLWDAGHSAGDIMRHFVGATRNAIIGVVHRAKWQRAPSVNLANSVRKNKERRKAVPNPPKPKVIKVKPATIDPVTLGDQVTEKVDWIHQERPPLPGTTPISLVDLPAREGGVCRFPVQGGYCGVQTGENMYCGAHHRCMYTSRHPEGSHQ